MLPITFLHLLVASCVFAGSEGLRFSRSPSGASSGSYSSSSSSSSSSGGGGGGFPGNFFAFPSVSPFERFNTPFNAYPMFDFNQMFRQFLATANAAQAFAAQNPAYAKVFQEQMSILAKEQQSALAQYPFAFPGFDNSNSVGGDGYSWAQTGGSLPTAGYGTTGGHRVGTGYGGSSGSYGTSGGGSYGVGGSGGYGGVASPSYGGGSSGGYGAGGSGGYGAGGSGGYGAGGSGGYGGGYSTGSDPSVFASSSANLGPGGGYIQASSAPGGPDGLGVRIAEEVPPPSGGVFGTFSSSSSGVKNVDGKVTSFKTSTSGINDNGKITFKTTRE